MNILLNKNSAINFFTDKKRIYITFKYYKHNSLKILVYI